MDQSWLKHKKTLICPELVVIYKSSDFNFNAVILYTQRVAAYLCIYV